MNEYIKSEIYSEHVKNLKDIWTNHLCALSSLKVKIEFLNNRSYWSFRTGNAMIVIYLSSTIKYKIFTYRGESDEMIYYEYDPNTDLELLSKKTKYDFLQIIENIMYYDYMDDPYEFIETCRLKFKE